MRRSQRHLRIAIDALTKEGLRVVSIRGGGRHTELHLSNGRVARLSRGTHQDINFERIARQDAKRMTRQITELHR